MTQSVKDQLDNGISSGDIPDNVKPPRWWFIQNKIATVKSRDAQIRWLSEQKQLENEIARKHNIKPRKKG